MIFERPDDKLYSVNEIEQYLRCPLGYYFRYVAGEKPTGNAFIALSLSMREAILQWFEARSAGQSAGSAGDVVDLFRSLVAVRGYRTRAADLVEAAEPALVSHIMRASSKCESGSEPREIRKKASYHLHSMRSGIKGEIPLILRDGTVIDIRVCMNGKKEADLAKDFRLSAYALLSAGDKSIGEEFAPSRLEIPVRMDVLVIGRQPRAQHLRGTRSLDGLTRFKRLVELAADGISKRAFPPTHPNNWNCSSRWCAYYEVCSRSVKQPEVTPTFQTPKAQGVVQG